MPEKFKEFIASLKSSKAINLVVLLLIVTAIPVTVFVARQQQETRQRAAENDTPAPIIAEEKKVAGILPDGKIDTEHALFLKRIAPLQYQELVKEGLVENDSEVQKIYNNETRTGSESARRSTSLKTNPPVLTGPIISTCGDIVTSGTYQLQQNIENQQGYYSSDLGNACINIHDVSNVQLDCQGHTISSSAIDLNIIPVLGKNVQNFSIKNCTLRSDLWPMFLNSMQNGTIQNNTFKPKSLDQAGQLGNTSQSGNMSYINIANSSVLDISNNVFNVTYQQVKVSSANIHNNTFLSLSAVPINISDGINNTFSSNTVDGEWDGKENALGWDVGADDGPVFNNQDKLTVANNTISNVWDCGIETVGPIKNSTFTGNNIKKAGYCGIGGWWWNSWLNNKVSNNIVNTSPYLFAFFRYRELLSIEQYFYFQDNTFNNNTFSNQTSISYNGQTEKYSTLMDLNTSPSMIPTNLIKLGNNIIKDNDFGQYIPAPNLAPLSIFVDGGGNKCGSSFYQSLNPPLQCLTSGLTATPTPTVAPAQTITFSNLKPDGTTAVNNPVVFSADVKDNVTSVLGDRYVWLYIDGVKKEGGVSYTRTSSSPATIYSSAKSSSYTLSSGTHRWKARVSNLTGDLYMDSNEIQFSVSGQVTPTPSITQPTPTPVSGSLKSIKFNGYNQYLYCQDSSCGGTNKLDYPGSGNWTVGAWIKTGSLSRQMIISKDSNTGRAFNFYTNGGFVTFDIFNTSGGVNTVSDTSKKVNDNNWHFVLVRYNFGGNTSSTLDIYIDGKLANSKPNVTGSIPDVSSSFSIASRTYPGYFDYFNGSVREPFVVADALNSSQISQIYQQGQVGSVLNGNNKIRGWWKFANSNSTNLDLSDISGFGNTLIAVGSPSIDSSSVPTPTSGQIPTPTSAISYPNLTITSPASNQYIKRGKSMTAKVSVSDSNGVKRVDYLFNGNVYCTSSSSPYSCTFLVPTNLPSGYNTFKATAYNNLNLSTSKSLTVILY